VPALVLVVASWFRLFGLSQPPEAYWDESYYAWDAYAYLGGGVPVAHSDDPAVKIEVETTWVHPPLGKWMIALGEGPLGFRPLGWRVPSALFGLAGVLLLYLIALELWGSAWWAGLAGFLLATDGLHVVQSRIAMLDVFVSTFVLAGLYLLMLDWTRSPERWSSDRFTRWFGSPYRLGAGMCMGAAVASKWSGIFGLAMVVAFAVAGRRRKRGRQGSPRSGYGSVVVCFLLVPASVYLVSYSQFFVEHGPDVPGFVKLQVGMLEHNLHHDSVQAENSSALTWPLLLHPIRYAPPQEGRVRVGREVLAVGNPVLWWGFLGLLPVLLLALARRRDWRCALVLGGYGAMYLPWLAFGRTQFMYYMLPAVPFMALGVAASVRALPPRFQAPAGHTVALLAAIAAAALAPVWMYLPVGSGWLRAVHLLPGWH
jgi:dolichyl-phosphate-mannose-protein mannosyltransferase